MSCIIFFDYLFLFHLTFNQKRIKNYVTIYLFKERKKGKRKWKNKIIYITKKTHGLVAKILANTYFISVTWKRKRIILISILNPFSIVEELFIQKRVWRTWTWRGEKKIEEGMKMFVWNFLLFYRCILLKIHVSSWIGLFTVYMLWKYVALKLTKEWSFFF